MQTHTHTHLAQYERDQTDYGPLELSAGMALCPFPPFHFLATRPICPIHVAFYASLSLAGMFHLRLLL